MSAIYSSLFSDCGSNYFFSFVSSALPSASVVFKVILRPFVVAVVAYFLARFSAAAFFFDFYMLS